MTAKDMAQNTVRLDEGEEESEVTQEARAGMRGGEKEKEETQGQETNQEKMEKAGGIKSKVMHPRRRTRNGCRMSLLRRVHTYEWNENHAEPHRFRIVCGLRLGGTPASTTAAAAAFRVHRTWTDSKKQSDKRKANAHFQ